MEVDHPGKLFIGGLHAETNEKTLEVAFGKFGCILEVLLMKDRETNKSRGFAFITFERPGDAKNAAKDMNGKTLDGKTIKVEQANKPYFGGGRKRRLPSLSRNRGPPRNVRCGRGGSGGTRGRPSRGRRLDDCDYSRNLSVSSKRSFPVKRGPSSKSGGPPPKRSSSSAPTRSNTELGRQGQPRNERCGRGGSRGTRGRPSHGRHLVSRVRENYGGGLRREPVSSRRDAYVSPRDDGYSSKDGYSSRGYPSSRDSKDYAPRPRDYAYHDYGHYSSRDEHYSKGYSDRDGYGRDRNYSEHPSGGSYRDTYESYGISRGAPPARGPPLTYGGNSRYDDYNSSRDGYGGSRESYLSHRSDVYSGNRSDVYSSGRERGSRHERGLPPSVDRAYPAPRESYGSSRCGGTRGFHRESQSERGHRSRY